MERADRAVHAWAWRKIAKDDNRTDHSVDDVRFVYEDGYEYSSYTWESERVVIEIHYHLPGERKRVREVMLRHHNPLDIIKECLAIYEELSTQTMKDK